MNTEVNTISLSPDGRAPYEEGERELVEAVIAFANLPPALQDPRDVIKLVEDHPWVLPQPNYRDWEGGRWPGWLRLRREDQAFIRDVLAGLIRDSTRLRGSHGLDIAAHVRARMGRLEIVRGRTEDEPTVVRRPRTAEGVVFDFTFQRRRGFVLEMHPVFGKPEEALWFGFAILLDERLGLTHGLTVCQARRPSAEDGECRRFFLRSVDRQRYCSARCADLAARQANVLRQQRFRRRRDRST